MKRIKDFGRGRHKYLLLFCDFCGRYFADHQLEDSRFICAVCLVNPLNRIVVNKHGRSNRGERNKPIN